MSKFTYLYVIKGVYKLSGHHHPKKHYRTQPTLSPVAFGMRNRDFILFVAWSDGNDITLQMGVEMHTALHINCLVCLIFAISVVTVQFFGKFSNIIHHRNSLSGS